MDDTKRRPINKFRGLNNVSDPFRLQPDWAVQADNVDITRTLGLSRCHGYTRASTNTNILGGYATIDQSRLYVVDGSELRSYNADMTYTVVRTGLSTAYRYAFEEVNGVVFYTNGVSFGVIEPSGWRPWGVAPPTAAPALSWTAGNLPYGRYSVTTTFVSDRGVESGNGPVAETEGEGQLNIDGIPQLAGHNTSVYMTMHDGDVYYLAKERAGTSFTANDEEYLGRELPFWETNLPRGDFPCFFQGRMWVAEWYPQQDLTVIWRSLPLQYQHFRYGEDGVTVPGQVRLMERAGDSLIIGTDRQIWATDGEKLEELAAYGVVEGFHGASLAGDERVFFWSLRGLCTALPFKNLTQDKLSVAPGSSAGAAVVEKDGMRRYVVALRQGGQPYNRR